MTEAPLDVLPSPGLLVGDGRITESSGGRHQHVYAATGRPTVEIAVAGEKEIAEAVACARAALGTWRGLAADRRRDLLLRLADLVVADAARLGTLQTVENGIPRQFTAAMPGVVADFLRYNAGWADKIGGDVITTWPATALDY
ncbi:MAG TPA: aldehyde dehydrogenase family protein, partial [Pilimelia sp.]|nr:aldehyde dehydrogenase family protein [Pilimelia sp.]